MPGCERSAVCRRRDLGPRRQRRHGSRRRLRGGGCRVAGVAAEGGGAARSDQREDGPASLGLHADGRPRDVDGIHAAAGVVPWRGARAPGQDHSSRAAGRPSDHARYPALCEADRARRHRRDLRDHEAVHARRQPPGGAGHGRSYDHHRSDRVHLIARGEPRVPDSRERRC